MNRARMLTRTRPRHTSVCACCDQRPRARVGRRRAARRTENQQFRANVRHHLTNP